MKKLLAVITRMYATRGGDDDEFVASWGGTEHQEFMIFPKDTNAWQRIMLLIHGYEYPRIPNDNSISRAGKSISQGLETNGLVVPDCEVGLLFHPPLTWGATAKDHFAETVLNSAGRVTFVREYRSASRLVKELAPMIKFALAKSKSVEEFSAEFDKVWEEYRSNLTRYDVRVGSVLTQIEKCVMPLINGLDYWREFGIEANSAAQLNAFHKTSREAMKKALDADGILKAIGRIVNSLILETRSSDKLEAIDKEFQTVESFLRSKEGSYIEMHETVELFNSSGDPLHDEVLKQLGNKIKSGNPIRDWYLELVEKLDDLRKVLARPDQ